MARKKIVILDELSEIRDPGPFKLQMPWIPSAYSCRSRLIESGMTEKTYAQGNV